MSQKGMDPDTLFECKPVLMDTRHPFYNQLDIEIENTIQNLTLYRGTVN